MKPSCLIIDDEPMARKGLAEDLRALDLIDVKGMAANAAEATKQLTTHPVDLLFLDIEMPGVSGLDWLPHLNPKPLIILVTAYPQYALEGYDHGVIDYLVKPVARQRLQLACEKAVEQHMLRSTAIEPYLYLKCNGVLEQVPTAKILYIEAANNYIQVHTPTQKLLVYQSLKGIEAQLPPGSFIQTHKSFLVARRHIQHVEGNTLLVGSTPIPISRRFKSSVLAQLPLTNKTRPLG
ncbi:MAG TPA: LytTR family DNA-binding domain-containing protein [Puia sp.]|nr:LytTR family DNA-binding domain-containing protein [Puia sp.]